ncbi:MAG: vWA domain-containing protein [Nocardioides sp.]
MAVLLRGVDRAAFVAALGQRLRGAGVPVGLTALTAFTRALEVSPPTDVPTLYWRARLTLVHQPYDLERFDAVFDAVFRDAVLGTDPHARRTERQPPPAGADELLAPVRAADAPEQPGDALPWHTLPRVAEPDEGDVCGQVLPELLPSAVEGFADTPFEDLDEHQMALLGAWLERSAQRWPTRRSRRMQVHPAGARVALRETMARSRRTGYEPVVLSHYRRVQRPRPIVMLGDVSQSMQSYSTAYLHLMRALARSGRAETFVFSTSLTRLTPALAHRSARAAITQASEQALDRYGGTHLAGSLAALLASRHGNDLRGGVLVVASDGWDSDRPEELAAAMTRVRRRVHRVVWLNPRAAAPDFAPLVGSMAAALPFCDAFLPAHTVRAMAEAFDAIAGASSTA